MCGIFGYVGKRGAAPILLEGIKALEYRGYDSAGLAVLDERGKISSEKAVGPVVNLEARVASSGFLTKSATSGIVHSRWATHGGVTEKNAHPHSDCQKNIWLVHNGIIENHDELKTILKKKGHAFRSETDSEVIAHLIEEAQGNGGKAPSLKLEDATRKALQRVRGTYGLVVMDRREPQKLVVARNFSPLILGVGEGEFFVASDATPILPHTRKIVYLKDGEMAVVTPEGRRIFSLSNHPVNRRAQDVDWSFEQAQKGNFKHFMLKEIFEQPRAIQNSCRGRLDLPGKKVVLGGLAEVQTRLKKTKRMLIVGCGTAHYAGRLGQMFFEELAGIPAVAEIASEWRYRNPVFQGGDVLLAVSQSGETADTLAALREAKKNKILTLGITNVVGSTLARETDAGVYQHIGPEIGVAATKSFLSQAAILLQIAISLGRDRGLSARAAYELLQALSDVPRLVEKALKQSQGLKQLASRYRRYEKFIFLGRKYSLPVALEGALKLKEISYVFAEGLGTGELKHGPIAMVDKNLPSIFVMPKDSVYQKNLSNLQEVMARGGPIIAITSEGNRELAKIVKDVVYIPKTVEILSPFLTAIPLQLFAYWSAVLRGCNVDKPRNLAKSVTVE